MTRRQRFAVVGVGVLMVLLFTAAVANPRGGDDWSLAESDDGLLGLISGLLGKGAGVDLADVDAECWGPRAAGPAAPARQLAFDGSCDLRVAPREGGLRVLTLRTEHPISVEAPPPIEVPEADPTMTAELEADETAQVPVGEDGADITLDCVDDDCVVWLGTE